MSMCRHIVVHIPVWKTCIRVAHMQHVQERTIANDINQFGNAHPFIRTFFVVTEVKYEVLCSFLRLWRNVASELCYCMEHSPVWGDLVFCSSPRQTSSSSALCGNSFTGLNYLGRSKVRNPISFDKDKTK